MKEDFTRSSYENFLGASQKKVHTSTNAEHLQDLHARTLKSKKPRPKIGTNSGHRLFVRARAIEMYMEISRAILRQDQRANPDLTPALTPTIEPLSVDTLIGEKLALNSIFCFPSSCIQNNAFAKCFTGYSCWILHFLAVNTVSNPDQPIHSIKQRCKFQ